MRILIKAIKTGIYIYLCITAWFFIMKLFGWDTIPELRFVNLLFAVFFTNRLARSNAHEIEEIGYLRNLHTLLTANGVAVVLSVLSLMAYVYLIDPQSLEILEAGFFWGSELSLAKIAVGLTLEGAAASLIVSFILMQYWKDQRKKIHHKTEAEKY